MRCSQELYVYRVTTGVSAWIVLWEVAKNCKFLYIPYRCKIEKSDTHNIMELKILKWKCAYGSSFVNIIRTPLSLKMSTTLRVVLSAEIIKEQRNAEAEKNLLVFTFNTVYCFQFAYIISSSVMLSIYAKLYCHVLNIRESGSKYAKKKVFTLARLKIVSTIKNLICRCLLYDYEMWCSQELCS